MSYHWINIIVYSIVCSKLHLSDQNSFYRELMNGEALIIIPADRPGVAHRDLL